MNVAQLHLILNHFPLVGFIAASVLLLYALWRRSAEARAIALVGIALSGLLILPVLVSGNASEEMVEHLPGVSEALIGRHEQAADTAGALALVAGGVALLALIALRWAPRAARAALGATLVLAVAAMVGIGWAAHLGGTIRHPEIALAWNAAGGEGGSEADEAHARGAWRSEAATTDADRRGGGIGGTARVPALRDRESRDDD